MSCCIKLIFLATMIVYVKAEIYSDFISDFVNYNDKNAMLTEFSCNTKESLLRAISNGNFINTVPTESLHGIPFPSPANRRYFVLDLDCLNSRNILKKANDLKYFSSPLRWIVLTKEIKNSSQSFVQQYFSDVDILIDSDVNFALINAINETAVVQKLYKKRKNFPIQVETYGDWTKSRGFIETNFFNRTAVRRRTDLSGATLNSCIVITQNDSLNHLTDKRNKHIDSIAKVSYVLSIHLAEIYNTSLNISVESTWGYKNNKSEWSGMIGELTTNKADIGGTSLFFTKSRVDTIDYIAMITPTRACFVFRQPKLSYVKNVYTLPFDSKVWMFTVLLVLIGCLTLYIVRKWEWKRKRFLTTEAKDSPMELQDSFLDVAFFTIGAVCQQGAVSLPFSLPGRISTICLFLSLMFLYTSYAANIVALMQSSSSSIITLADLLKSRLSVGVTDTVYSRVYFPAADEPVRKALYNQKVAPKGKKDSNFMSLEEGVSKMRQGLFAFHMETGAGYKLVGETFQEHEKCGLQEIPFIQVLDPWLAIQKNSSYKEMLKIGLRLIRESGVQARENALIYTKKPGCKSGSSTFISVGLVDCYTAIAILGVGAAISTILFLLELYLKHRIKFNVDQWSKCFTGRVEEDSSSIRENSSHIQCWDYNK